MTATAHKLARVVYAVMRHGVGYARQTQEQYAEQARRKVERQFHQRAKELGYQVTKVEPVTPMT